MFVTDGNQRGVALTRETREPNRDAAREHGRAVEYNKSECAAAQQHVRTPRRTRCIAWANHPDAGPFAEVRPVARRERARRIHVRDPQSCFDRALDDAAHERRLAAAHRADDLRQPPPRHTFAGQHRIELAHARGQTRSVRFGEVENFGELLPQGSEGHEKPVRSASAWNSRRGGLYYPNKTRKQEGQKALSGRAK